jgi:hypothetical protein
MRLPCDWRLQERDAKAELNPASRFGPAFKTGKTAGIEACNHLCEQEGEQEAILLGTGASRGKKSMRSGLSWQSKCCTGRSKG